MASSAAAIGKRLVAMHTALGISQADVCRATGFKENRYSQYVNGVRPLTLGAAMKIADAYGVTLDYLFRGNPGSLPANLQQKILIAEAA